MSASTGAPVGQPVTIDILRDGVAQRESVTVVARPDDLDRFSSFADPRANRVARLGVLAVKLDAQVAALLPPTRARSGVVVASTVAGAIDSADGGLAPRRRHLRGEPYAGRNRP